MQRPRPDRLELWLTLSLPWLGLLVLAAGQAWLRHPRPLDAAPERVFAVGVPREDSVPLVDPASDPPRVLGAITGPALYDLAASDERWLRRWPRGAVARGAVSFDPARLRIALTGDEVTTGDEDVEVGVSFLEPPYENLALIDVHRFNLVSATTWDTYLHRLGEGTPEALLARRDEPERLVLGGRPGELTLGSRALERRNRRLVFSQGRFTEHAVRQPGEHVAWLLAGTGAALAWWAGLLALVPTVGVLLLAWRPVRRVAAAWRAQPAPMARALLVAPPLLLAVGLSTAALIGVAAARQFPAWDTVTGLAAPVVLATAVALGLAIGAPWHEPVAVELDDADVATA